jgi:hypothetical protein
VYAALTQLGTAIQVSGNTLLIVLAGAALVVGLVGLGGGREIVG